MTNIKKIPWFLALSMIITAGCAPIPTSEHFVQLQKEFPASFEEVWNSSLQVIETFDGTIITKDKSSGLITCKITGNKTEGEFYTNIFVTASQNEIPTVVFVTPYNSLTYSRNSWEGPSSNSKNGVITEVRNISFHKNHFINFSNTFYKRLEDEIRGNKS